MHSVSTPVRAPLARVLVPAAVFFTVALLASGALAAAQPATGVPGEVIELVQFGPAVAVAVAALLWRRRTGSLLAGTLSGRPRAAVLLTAPLIIAVAAGAYGLLRGTSGFTGPGHPFALIAVAQFAGACAEEIGWRCWLQPLLRTRYGVLASSITVGVLWAVWHVQVFAQDPLYAASFVLGAVSMSVVLGIALDRGGRRLAVAGAFHTLINLGMLLFMDEESGAVAPMALFGASCLLAALVWASTARASIRA
ncbi:MAG TPA: CPBP family intramembrane glutamic endopeptidase [Phytomonospora sp.]